MPRHIQNASFTDHLRAYPYTSITGSHPVFTASLLEASLAKRSKSAKPGPASEKEFRLLAEAMPQIVWVTRADGWTTYFNQKWVDYTG